MELDPQTVRGAATWAGLALGATVLALLVASLFPGIIPARAQGVNL
jgi:hypothetical protein